MAVSWLKATGFEGWRTPLASAWNAGAPYLGAALLVALAMVTALALAVTATSLKAAAAPEGDGVRLRQMERLDRGLVAVKVDDGVFLSWRWLGTEPRDIGFHIYRDGGRITEAPIVSSTNYLDPDGTEDSTYHVRAVLNGVEQEPSRTVSVWKSLTSRCRSKSPRMVSIPTARPTRTTRTTRASATSTATASTRSCSNGSLPTPRTTPTTA